MKLFCKSYEELDLDELYELLALRQKVFVVEQNCPYQDADFKDMHCYHVLGYQDGELIAYARIVPKGLSYKTHHAIGRVIMDKEYRGQGLGEELMKACLQWTKEKLGDEIRLSAQVYALTFYEKLGFETVGQSYMEDDIPHIAMEYKAEMSS